MTRCFADTSYFVALVSADDDCHEDAVLYTEHFEGRIVTTAWVLNEFANFLSRPPNRSLFTDVLAMLKADARVEIVPPDVAGFEAGLRLFSERPDKEWSLVDCISFVVMGERGITDALTKDHHFEQAGFTVLLK